MKASCDWASYGPGFNEQIFGVNEQILGQDQSDQKAFGPLDAEREGPNRRFDPALLTCPGQQWPGPFPVLGSNEQIFGAD
jgi:hypothetical protein